MKNNYTKFGLFLLGLLFTVNFYAQNRSFWTKTDKNSVANSELAIRKTEPIKGDFYQLDIAGLKSVLQNAPVRMGNNSLSSRVIVDFPMADGEFEPFQIMEASVMTPEFQANHPSLRSYVGQSINNPETIIRFSITPRGLHTMLLSSRLGTQYIDPYTKGGNTYLVYSKRNLPTLDDNILCGFDDDGLTVDTDFDVEAARNANDGNLRTFRLALACTVEYSSFHWMAAGYTAITPESIKRQAVLDAMVVTMTRVNGIYERELSITMEMVDNTSIIFITSDSFSNDNANTLINQSQTVIDAAIGSANYDIGHTFSTGGGGLAQLNSPCTANKARGITGLPAPVGDAYDIDFVCHELGHQYGAPHTFNGSTGNCAGGNRTASNAYEPGSGSTIMAYAGICAPQNVQSNSDAYFHQKSLQMIWANVTTGASTCGAQSSTGNSAPVADAGASYNVPISTPYMLTASSTDADGTASHTFTWEQYDLGPAGVPTETTATGPLVRSFEGTTNPTRYIPNIPDLLQAGGSTTWEKLVSINRDIDFQVTVRDNDPRGGRTASDEMTVTTTTTSGPFLVTSQSTGVTWSPGNTETITWDVAGTDSGVVNEANVDILLSTDGGLTFETTLASSVPNVGSYDIIVPDVLEENCLIMVKASNNIFFNINTSRFAIGYNLEVGEECTTYSFDLNQTLNTNAGTFDQIPVNIDGSGTITDVNVTYDISSTALNQLHMAVVSAEGTRGYLYPAGPCSTGANMQVTWDHESTESVVCGTDPITGTAMPVPTTDPEPLDAIYGEEMNGTWVVMAANIGPTNMVFNSADLEICKIGTVASLAPTRVTQSTVQVDVSSSVTIDDTHLVVTSPNTATVSDIQFTVTTLPTEGTAYLNGAALAINDTFTQADINNGNVTYTTTLDVDGTDGFRVDVDDNNGGTLPNLLINIQIIDGLSVDEFGFDVFNVYPNPSNGNVTVQLSTYEDVTMSLFDIRGREVYNNTFSNNTSFKKEVNLGAISTGMYLLQVKTGSKTATKKIVIK